MILRITDFTKSSELKIALEIHIRYVNTIITMLFLTILCSQFSFYREGLTSSEEEVDTEYLQKKWATYQHGDELHR